ncbi:hypothetical protein FOZ60_008351 [Perkinsus olseni]|uniref:Uncharacterized protein n=1 Tax=Perkinsus olseni TaxID=32597 RepID=A0A7J6NJI4_PEROL|nr:hypothetical protein FOZ60_008351 [Perkinsus olseni]
MSNLSSPIPTEVNMPIPPKPVGVCLVGLGRAGKFHLEALGRLGPRVVKILYVVDVKEDLAKERAKELGCIGLTDMKQAMEDPEVQAVIVGSTTYMHHEHIMAALKAGKACLTEKPIADNQKELQQLIDYVNTVDVPFRVGYQRRTDPNFRVLKRQIEMGMVGEPRIINCTSRDNPEPPMEYLKVSGGIFHDMLTHDFDMIHYLTGQVPESVYSIGHAYNPKIQAMDDVDTAMVTLKYPNGLLATVNTSRIAPYGYDQRVEVFGPKGMATAENQRESTVTLATDAGFQSARAEYSFPERYPEAYLESDAEFIKMVIEKKKEDPADNDRFVMLDKVARAAEMSLHENRVVFLNEFDN